MNNSPIRAARLTRIFVTQSSDYLFPERLTSNQMFSRGNESLNWSRDDLVRLLRARILIATGGRYDSLDALSSPGLNAIEEQITSTVQPLRRAALYLAGQLLHSHITRRSALSALIEPEDLINVVESYQCF